MTIRKSERGTRGMAIGSALAGALSTSSCSPSEPESSCASCTLPLVQQAELDALAASLRLELAVLDNAPQSCPSDARFASCHEASLTLHNDGPPFAARGWELHFPSLHRALSAHPGELGIEHRGGSANVASPTAAFTGFGGSGAKQLRFVAEGCWIAESQALPGAYLSGPGLSPAPVSNTGRDPVDWLSPLASSAQTQCGPESGPGVATAAFRFAANQSMIDRGPEASALEIVPRPRSLIDGSGFVQVASGVTLVAPELDPAALSHACDRFSLVGMPCGDSGLPVRVSVDASSLAWEGVNSEEAYRLRISADGVEVVGSGRAGALYGVESVIGLSRVVDDLPAQLPAVEIPLDSPRYAYRGIQLDLARNFFGVTVLERLLGQMASYKLNALHLHLSDDEGFRLEIPGLRELTELGARRCHDPEEQRCLMPQLGSGPTAETSGTGHLARSEFIDLLRLATALGIEVIPEFDVPAHARAAIRSMNLRADRGDPTFLLSDRSDKSQYLSVQGYRDNVLNPCLDSSYKFVAHLMDAVQQMYAEAQAPLTTWHTGADEVPEGAWEGSPACATLLAKSPQLRTPSDLGLHFLQRVNELAQARGIGMRVWADGVSETTFGAEGGSTEVAPSSELGGGISAQAYSPLRFFDDGLGPLADAGYPIVLSSADLLYLDHAQEAHPAERGAYWAARATDLRKVFSLSPDNLAASAKRTAECAEGSCDYFLSNATPIRTAASVLGVEAAQWSEVVRTAEQLEFMLYPRLLAFAERAWHRAAWEPAFGMDMNAPFDDEALDADWQRFAHALAYKELRKLERAGVRYRIEVPGARRVGAKLETNAPLPGLTLEVTTDPVTTVRVNASDGRQGRAISVPTGDRALQGLEE